MESCDQIAYITMFPSLMLLHKPINIPYPGK